MDFDKADTIEYCVHGVFYLSQLKIMTTEKL